MKQFLVFYNSSFDPEAQAQTYADEAAVHARACGKQVASQIVDVTGSSALKRFWAGRNTIECVSVDNDSKKEGIFNPSSLADIDGMIDRL